MIKRDKYLPCCNPPQKLEHSEIDKLVTLGHDVIAESAITNTTQITRTLLKDGHGSTRILTEASVATTHLTNSQFFLYDAYGNMIEETLANFVDSANALTSILYSGQQTDQTGMQYLRARYYDPSTGRFNRLDPFAGNNNDPQSLHKYTYAHNNPVMGSDPTGLFTLTEVQTSITTIVRNFSTYATKIGRVVNAIDRIIDTIDFTRFMLQLAGGGINVEMRKVWKQYYSKVRKDSGSNYIFTSSYWNASSASFARNSLRLLSVMYKADSFKLIQTLLNGSSKTRFVIILPVPYLKSFNKISGSSTAIQVKIPFTFNIKGRKIPIVLQLGGGGPDASGSVLGLAIQKRKRAVVNTIFRQDSHHWHVYGSDDDGPFKWLDVQSGSNKFHYNVPDYSKK